jgi:hypothetical protein
MITIASHHNGPPGSGHGGVTAGRLAELVDPCRAAVRLHAPIPIETPLVPTRTSNGAVELRSGADLVATARPLDRQLEVAGFDPLPAELVARAEQGWPSADDHSFPTCFGCGPARRSGDGLLLRPGPVPGHDVNATGWAPPGSGETPAWLIWAALDCASAGPAVDPAAPGQVMVTGELAVEVRRPVTGGAACVLVSRQVSVQGRKVVTEAALLDGSGSMRAVALATWFRVAGEVAA